MFASEILVDSQKTQIVAVLGNTSKYSSRSVAALAHAINESPGYTESIIGSLIAEDSIQEHHVGSQSGKVYYTLAD